MESVRNQLLEGHKNYLICLGQQIHVILEEGVVHEESLALLHRDALDLYRISQAEEVKPYMKRCMSKSIR